MSDNITNYLHVYGIVQQPDLLSLLLTPVNLPSYITEVFSLFLYMWLIHKKTCWKFSLK